MKKELILKTSVDVIDYDEIIEIIKHSHQPLHILSGNPEMCYRASKEEQLQTLINKAEICIADGIGTVYASKILGGSIKTRVTGIDLMEKLLTTNLPFEKKVFLLGAKKDVVQTLAKKYAAIVVGFQDGYSFDKTVVDKINKSQANILFVALGAPTQELWIENNRHLLPHVKVFQGVGGSFDVLSGKKRRAPKVFIALKLEWLYRLLREPKRLFKQTKLILFIFAVIKQKRQMR